MRIPHAERGNVERGKYSCLKLWARLNCIELDNLGWISVFRIEFLGLCLVVMRKHMSHGACWDGNGRDEKGKKWSDVKGLSYNHRLQTNPTTYGCGDFKIKKGVNVGD
jgi:hypothetical protein